MEDGQLVRQALDGNRGAFATLVERYTGLVLALCRARVHRLDDAEDLTQEAFTAALEDLQSLRDPDKFGAWLLGIARRLCCAWRGDVRRRMMCFCDVPRQQDGAPDPCLDPPAPADPLGDGFDELRAEVEQFLRPWPRLRQTFMLWYAERTTYERLGELLGVTPAVICRRLARARDILCRCLRRRLCE
ncbi:MAG: RNA polymerase sigma factor [Gemmataceae bacterium]|nr:RNA polymerase sigma factor [Gemmataceae bacterium]